MVERDWPRLQCLAPARPYAETSACKGIRRDAIFCVFTAHGFPAVTVDTREAARYHPDSVQRRFRA